MDFDQSIDNGLRGMLWQRKSDREVAALSLVSGLAGQRRRALLFMHCNHCLMSRRDKYLKTLYMVGEENIYSSSFDIIDFVDGLFSGCNDLFVGWKIHLVILINCM